MSPFPLVDPLPLPAPVWLFKVLHDLFTAMHFGAIHLLVGGLFVASAWALAGWIRKRDEWKEGTGLIAQRLPFIMAFLVNFGVPPLLFAQVLYGRCLYTSSILMGVFWFAVIPLLVVLYFQLYAGSERLTARRGATALFVFSTLIVSAVAYLYSCNMTLMLRPAVWPEMYRASAAGFQLPAGDPTIVPRWLAMLLSSLQIFGVYLILLARKRSLAEGVRHQLRSTGTYLSLLFGCLAAACVFWVLRAQPAGIVDAVFAQPLYRLAGWLWLGLLLANLTLALLQRFRPAVGGGLATLLILGAFLQIQAFVLFRSGIRDMSLLAQGFDVWTRVVTVNPPYVGLFLFTVVAAVPGLAWLTWVLFSAKEVEEHYA